jgi:hypothetical protein
MNATTAAVVAHRALLVQQGAVIGEGRNSATARYALPLAGQCRHRGANIAVYLVSPWTGSG